MSFSSFRRFAALFFVVAGVVACAGPVEEPGIADDDEPLARRSDVIALASGPVDTFEGGEDVRELAGGRVLLKFPAPPTAGQLEALDDAVERIDAYLPDDALLVKLRAGARADLATVGATWTARYRPEHKLSPGVAAAARARGDAPVIVMVTLFHDADAGRTLDAMRGAGVPDGAVVGRGAGASFQRVRLLLSGVELERLAPRLAALPEVFWVDVEGRRVFTNDTTVWVGQSGLDGGQSTPVHARGLLGQGQIVGLIDSGIDVDMCYFRDATRGLPPKNECDFGTKVDLAQRKVIAVDFLWDEECQGGISDEEEWDGHGHGTHVAGTIAGDDLANPLGHDPGDGMAPAAKLVVQDCGGPEVDNCADCSGIGCPVVDLNPYFQQAYDQGARIHNDSWGDNENAWVQNNYTAGSQDVDEFMWSHKDFLIVFAAGNSGPGTGSVGSPATAKSVLAVGATRRGSGADGTASFSSCGPTDDGRIKPEVMVPGHGIISADFDGDIGTHNCGRAAMSGTSMAAPGAAGLAALARQYFTDGFYPTGAAVAANRFTPSAALVRAVLVGSSRNMSGVAAMPSSCQGWGRITLDDALFFPGDARRLSVRDDGAGFPRGAAGETRTYRYTVRAGQPLKVTLAWTDFPSTPAAAKHLVNDLDLEVRGPGGTYLGNVFASGQSTTGGAADRKNTVEQVLLAAPAAGEYSVLVKAFTVPSGPQPFALVVTGDLSGEDGAPVADAGSDRGAAVGTVVTLDGRGSRDPDGGPSPLAYAWRQTGGPAVTLTGPAQAVAGFVPARAGSYAFELTVTDGAASATDGVTVTVTGADAQVVFEDDLESERGWTVNPSGSDTATRGAWERGNPSSTSKQLGKTVSGLDDLVTGRFAGSGAGSYDLDGGLSSVVSPAIAVPAGRSVLALSYYLAHAANSTTLDRFRVKIVGAEAHTVLEVRGAEAVRDPAWARVAIPLDAFAGQTVKILLEAADNGRSSLLEAAVDDVAVLRL